MFGSRPGSLISRAATPSGGIAAAMSLVAAVAILFARDPAHVLSAEFWAEDGWFWYPDAYRIGVRSLFVPLVGYFQTVSRLVGLVAQLFALRWGPTLFAVCALVFQALPAAFLVSRRMDRAWPGRRGRVLFALVYLVLPNETEVYDNVTNGQWHLAVLAFLVLASERPWRVGAAVFDGLVLLVSGLSGPFCLLLAPMAALRWWRERNPGTLARLAIVLGTVVVQGTSLLLGVHTRSMTELGASLVLLARIVVQQIMFGALYGQESLPVLLESAWWQDDAVALAVAAGGLLLVAAAVVRGSALVRYGVLFGTALFAAALLRPQISITLPQWPLMLLPGVGSRYYYVPMLVWLGVLFTLAADRLLVLRAVAWVLLLGLGVGVWQDFRMPARPSTGFLANAKAFERAAPGTSMSFPLLPLGLPEMRLTKHLR